jgi:hypothetical protein
MMATYAEYLKSQGASEEEIKILDTAIARKAYERLEASVVANHEEAVKQAKIATDYQANVNEWFDKHDKEFKTVESSLIAAKANEARAVAALRTAHERGMIDVAKDLGYNFDQPNAPVKKEEGAPALDASKYFTKDDILAIATKESEAIAIMSDIAAEHVYLFGAPLRSARELRAEAVKRNLPLEQVWMEKFGVAKARTDREAADTKAKEDVLRKQITEQVTAEFASKYANPDTRPLESSRSPFAPRPAVNREKAPWETNLDGENGSNDRVRRATLNAMKSQGVH